MLKFLVLSLFLLCQLAHPAAIVDNDGIGKLLQEIEKVPNGPQISCDQELLDVHGQKLDVSVVSLKRAEGLFRELAARPEIPFGYPEDGCHARAHAMARILERKGIITGKAFLEGDLRVETPNSPKGYVGWWYHVAPMLKVKVDGVEKIYVLDPSIFDRPVPIEEWYDIQSQPSKRKAAYFTNRFVYQPPHKWLKLTKYRVIDKVHMDVSMKKYLDVQRQRRGKST